MNLLLEIYNKFVLSEAIDVNSVTDSIKHRYQVTINYEGDPEHGIAPGMRTVQAYAYGLTKAGNPVIRAYQPYGDTASETPSWKFFRLDRVTSWKPTYYITTKPAPNFNPNGDRSMSVVYSIADFSKPAEIPSATGPKQTYKQVGTLPDIEKILASREKEKATKQQQQKASTTRKPTEPEIKGIENTRPQEIPEPEVQGVETNNPAVEPENQPKLQTSETPNSDLYRTKGDEELEKVKDLNRRLDNTRKIDLSQFEKNKK
jgi:hypothetical protein